jgi:hypothetical protein
MKTLKILAGLLIVLGFTFNSVLAQDKHFTEEQFLYLGETECLGEALYGTVLVDMMYPQYPSLDNSLLKFSGTLYGEGTNAPYEVKMIQPGHFVWSDKTGLNATFTSNWHIFKNGKFVAVVHTLFIFKMNPNGKFLFHGPIVENCK